MIQALCIMGGLGVVIGIVLAAASKIFYVYVDPKILAIEDALPGANCGGCGFPGCSANAEAIAAGKAAPNSCVAAGPEVAIAIAGILGVSVEAREPDIARPGCTYGVQDADLKYIYDGLNDCRAAAMLSGGMKVCSIGCLGLGTCAAACPFDAIVMGPKGLPVVDEEKCTGCGTCERVCPKNIINLSSVTRRILREYTLEDCTTPCQRACPAGINIKEYIRQITLGNYEKSIQVIKERLPFPGVIGRICPRPCEDQCRRQYVDEPVAIDALKRFVSDYEKENNTRVQPFKAPDTGRHVAVIGGGVEGLSTAFFTARLGHAVTVFEATENLGGLLRNAIARERLPMEVLDWDIQGILDMGVVAQTQKIMGRDITVDSLLGDGFQAVFTASGGWDNRMMRQVGHAAEQVLPNTCLLLDVLNSSASGQPEIHCNPYTVIEGGGRLAVDAARICLASGAAHLTIAFRETRDQMPFDDNDIKALEKEGISIIFNVGISRLLGEGSHLTDVEYKEIDTGARQTIPAQTLIISAGRFPELVFVPRTEKDSSGSDADVDAVLRWEGVAPYKKLPQTNQTGLFAVGDAVTDYGAAVKAIGAGRRGAASIHALMYDIALYLPENTVNPQAVIQNIDHVECVEPQAREIMPLASAAELAAGSEVEKGFSEEMARREADRCLQCGLICYKAQGIKKSA
jgi:NADPH-dependent glutamate synthase beta subunit-like oxidoreductase